MSAPRVFFSGGGLRPGADLALPAGAARHVQVLRLQPGARLALFDGLGGQWSAQVLRMGRSSVEVSIGEHEAIERELPFAVTLAFAMPSNDRMDDLVEKATELGATRLQPLMSERSVLRLAGERAERKREHWQAVAAAACAQCGRNRVPDVAPVHALDDWLAMLSSSDRSRSMQGGDPERLLLSTGPALPWSARAAAAPPSGFVLLSGPEGGFSAAEDAASRAAGFEPISLGPRVLRADTAPLAALAALSLGAPASSIPLSNALSKAVE